MNKINLKTSAFTMSYAANEQKVRDMVRALDIGLRRQPHSHTPGGISVTSVCFEPVRCRTIPEYIDNINSYIAPPAAAGSAMVAFPELCGMTAMSLMPRFSSILADLHKLKKGSAEDMRDALFTVAETVQGFVGEIYLNVFSQLARSHRMIIAAGGMYRVENGKLYNRLYLFSEEGDVIGVQNKLFLSHTERMLGVTPGDTLTPGNSRIGKIALLGGSVLNHYEPFWIAANYGCRFAVASSSPFVRAQHHLARYRAQESGMCVLVPGISGGADFKLSFASPSGIYSPRELSEENDGVLAEGLDERLITAKFDLFRSAAQFDTYGADKNIRFFRRLIARDI